MANTALIRKMRELRREYRFTATEQALFYELLAMHRNNKNHAFISSNDELCLALNINEKTLVKSRATLIRSGLAFYSPGISKRTASRYSFTQIPGTTTVNNTVVRTANEVAKETVEKPARAKPVRFIPPTVGQVADYCAGRGNNIDAQTFFDFYTAKNWMIGKNKMKNWQAAVRTWENMNKRKGVNNATNRPDNTKPKDYTKGF